MKLLPERRLAYYSTMRLGGPATAVCQIESPPELLEALVWAEQRQLPVLMIGGGSNIIWQDEGFAGLVIVNAISGFQLQAEGDTSLLTLGAGEPWDKTVARTVAAGLSGIEALSLIPGSCGGTPIQNVGAYGQEIADCLVSLTAYDRQQQTFVSLAASDCGFGYRTSRFKTSDRGRFYITSLTLRLQLRQTVDTIYPAIQHYLDQQQITGRSPADIRRAVIAVRQAKLPDPAVIGNTGSFFANPVIDADAFARLQADYPDLPHWTVPSGVKVAGAWLIEQAGYKDYHDPVTGMATWGNQPLVLVNEAASSTADLLAFKQKIVIAVADKFSITLEQEPELLP